MVAERSRKPSPGRPGLASIPGLRDVLWRREKAVSWGSSSAVEPRPSKPMTGVRRSSPLLWTGSSVGTERRSPKAEVASWNLARFTWERTHRRGISRKAPYGSRGPLYGTMAETVYAPDPESGVRKDMRVRPSLVPPRFREQKATARLAAGATIATRA